MALERINKLVVSYCEIPEKLTEGHWISENSCDSYVEVHIEDEENSTRQELVFVKRNKKYTYAAFVNFMVNPYSCITKTEFRRAVKK